MTATRTATLAAHPESSCGFVDRIEARAAWSAGALAFGYAVHGDLARVRIPPPAATRRVDGLWRHTCFEAFVSHSGNGAYYEFNFSPSGEWNMHRFRAYREHAPQEEIGAPRIAIRRNANTFELNASIALRTFAALDRAATLRVGLAAVIEEKDGVLYYWALGHRPGKPDFHHADNFLLELSRDNGTAR